MQWLSMPDFRTAVIESVRNGSRLASFFGAPGPDRAVRLIAILAAAKEKKLIGEINMGSTVYSTVVPAHGALFVANRNQLFALAVK